MDAAAQTGVSIDMEVCKRCGDQVKVVSSIEGPAVIAHILKHLKHKAASARPTKHARSTTRTRSATSWTHKLGYLTKR